MKSKHISVMKNEVLREAQKSKITNKTCIDATLGKGGHSSLILKLKPKTLICFDLDQTSINKFKSLIKNTKNNLNKHTNIYFFNENFANIKSIIKNHDYLKSLQISLIIADLGLSQDQIESDKGFSFKADNFLDLRMNKSKQNITAADLINILPFKKLNKIFKDFADIKYSQILSKNIILKRKKKKINTTFELNKIVLSSKKKHQNKNQELQKTYQALRIAVNSEYKNLKEFLKNSFDILEKQGKLIIISFHSGEEKLISQFIKSHKNKISHFYKKFPQKKEIHTNKRSRTAQMHVICKT